jgi:hypothetical protein
MEKRKIIEMIGYPYFVKEEKSPTVLSRETVPFLNNDVVILE